jgi:mono/diheme cytochrome c family protein
MDAILYGRAMMPAMGNSMTPAERQDLLAYLHTL